MSRNSTCATTWPRSERRVPIRESELVEVEPTGAVGVDDERARQAPATSRCRTRPAFMRTPPPAVPGIAHANSKPPRPAASRPMEADRVGGTTACDEEIAVHIDCGELSGEPNDERVDSVVGREQIRPEADRNHRQTL